MSIELPYRPTNEQASRSTTRDVRRASRRRAREPRARLPVAGASRRRFRSSGYTPRPGEDMELQINIVTALFRDDGDAGACRATFEPSDAG